MQVLFGVVGDSPEAIPVFDRLAAASEQSNRGLAPTVVSTAGIRIGHTSRAFATWDRDATGTVHLSGHVVSIDGRDTIAAGASADELAALLRLFSYDAASAWTRIDGTYCLMVLDRGAAHLGVDLAGTHAIYWWQHDGLLAFHSHLADLAPSYPGTLTEHHGAIGAYLGCGQYPPGTTPYREIHHLGAGQYLTFRDGRVSVGEHFRNVFPDSPSQEPQGRFVDELVELVSSAVGRCWRAARSPVVPLSGGLDSRYITAELVSLVADRSAVRTITWGEDPYRAGSDAVIAAQVAAALGVENTWYEKAQRPTPENLDRAIYLSSGEGDCAIHYPDDHVLHAELAARAGFVSLFRGDESSGNYEFVTPRAGAAEYLFVRATLRQGYRRLLPTELVAQMANEQSAMIESDTRRLRSRTPQDKAGEIYYSHWLRRMLGPYNAVKNADLDVFNPFLDRRIIELMKRIPGHLRTEKKDLVLLALQRRHPQIAALPFAATGNLPDWGRRFRSDPTFARLFRDSCASPGWLDSVGARETVLDAFEAMERDAAASARVGTEAPATGSAAGHSWRDAAKHTAFGKLVREVTMERRFASGQPAYLRLARLVVLHRLLGSIEQRRSGLPGPLDIGTQRPEATPTRT